MPAVFVELAWIDGVELVGVSVSRLFSVKAHVLVLASDWCMQALVWLAPVRGLPCGPIRLLAPLLLTRFLSSVLPPRAWLLLAVGSFGLLAVPTCSFGSPVSNLFIVHVH